jgi:hypothetical protein
LEEFNEQFVHEKTIHLGGSRLVDIKAFLSTSITQAVAEERARVVGEIEGMKNKKHVCEGREGWGCEYETAIDDLLSSLDKEINNKE